MILRASGTRSIVKANRILAFHNPKTRLHKPEDPSIEDIYVCRFPALLGFNPGFDVTAVIQSSKAFIIVREINPDLPLFRPKRPSPAIRL